MKQKKKGESAGHYKNGPNEKKFVKDHHQTPSRAYDLPEARRGHRLGSYEAENFVDGPTQFPLHRRVGNLRIETRDLIAKLLQLHHAPRTKDVRPDGERL